MKSQEFLKLHNRVQLLKSKGLNNLTSKQREWYQDNIEYYNFLRLFPQNQAWLQNATTVSNKVETLPQQQEEKLELIRNIKKLEQAIAWTKKDLEKMTAPNRAAGNWNNIDYEDKVQLIVAAQQRLEQYKEKLKAYETQ
jgi:hypothetical protein